MTVRRIAFVDIDGVLNSEEWRARVRRGEVVRPFGEAIDLDAIARLNRLAAQGVEFVLSSAWRHRGMREVGQIFERVGFASKFVGCTPLQWSKSSVGIILARTRGQDIAAWLESRGHHADSWGRQIRFACLDDDTNMVPVLEHWVRCDFETGLLDEHVGRAAQLLGIDPLPPV